MPRLNQQIKLPDGRRLGYDEHGPAGGIPLFYFHGSPSSRLEFNLYGDEELLQKLHVRLLAVDRPGLGLSDFQPNRRMVDWAEDVLTLADQLGIEHFAILAYSLGGLYGMVCAYAIPQRLTKIGIVSGAALFTEPKLWENINEGTRRFLNMPRENPLASQTFLWVLRATVRFAPNKFLAQANSLLPAPDREVVSQDPEFQKGFIRMANEAMRQGTRGAFHESLLTISEWGFGLQDIQTPLHLWHGEMDKNIPVEMARYIVSALPKCEAKFYPKEGHLSLFKKNAEEIIRVLSN